MQRRAAPIPTTMPALPMASKAELVAPSAQHPAAPHAERAAPAPLSSRPMPRLPALLSLYLALVACSGAPNRPGMISERIGDVVRDPAAREVHLGKLTSFGWDRFVVFKPGTPRDEVCEFIGAGRSSCGRIVRYAAVPEDCVAIAFALDNKLTHIELHALANGRFDATTPPRSLPRAEAVFRIHRETPERIWLEPKQSTPS